MQKNRQQRGHTNFFIGQFQRLPGSAAANERAILNYKQCSSANLHKHRFLVLIASRFIVGLHATLSSTIRGDAEIEGEYDKIIQGVKWL